METTKQRTIAVADPSTKAMSDRARQSDSRQLRTLHVNHKLGANPEGDGSLPSLDQHWMETTNHSLSDCLRRIIRTLDSQLRNHPPTRSFPAFDSRLDFQQRSAVAFGTPLVFVFIAYLEGGRSLS
jgi:hypothetical protein